MELLNISSQSIMVLASFVVPGFFALRMYSRVVPKVDKDFPRVLVESLAYSVIITGLYNALLTRIDDDSLVNVTSIQYFLPLLFSAMILGYAVGRAASSKIFKNFMTALKLQGASDDFMDDQFRKVGQDELLTVTLKNGEIFRGVRAKIGTYRKDEPQMCYFNYFSWYDGTNGKWDARAGSLIFSLQDVQYIETPKKLPDN